MQLLAAVRDDSSERGVGHRERTGHGGRAGERLGALSLPDRFGHRGGGRRQRQERARPGLQGHRPERAAPGDQVLERRLVRPAGTQQGQRPDGRQGHGSPGVAVDVTLLDLVEQHAGIERGGLLDRVMPGRQSLGQPGQPGMVEQPLVGEQRLDRRVALVRDDGQREAGHGEKPGVIEPDAAAPQHPARGAEVPSQRRHDAPADLVLEGGGGRQPAQAPPGCADHSGVHPRGPRVLERAGRSSPPPVGRGPGPLRESAQVLVTGRRRRPAGLARRPLQVTVVEPGPRASQQQPGLPGHHPLRDALHPRGRRGDDLLAVTPQQLAGGLPVADPDQDAYGGGVVVLEPQQRRRSAVVAQRRGTGEVVQQLGLEVATQDAVHPVAQSAVVGADHPGALGGLGERAAAAAGVEQVVATLGRQPLEAGGAAQEVDQVVGQAAEHLAVEVATGVARLRTAQRRAPVLGRARGQ